MNDYKFGRLRLSVKGANNDSGFDILYDFGKSHDFVEFTSQKEFLFIKPWMQFPSNEYSDTCKLVSIEMVRRFNGYQELESKNESLKNQLEKYKSEKDMEIEVLEALLEKKVAVMQAVVDAARKVDAYADLTFNPDKELNDALKEVKP